MMLLTTFLWTNMSLISSCSCGMSADFPKNHFRDDLELNKHHQLIWWWMAQLWGMFDGNTEPMTRTDLHKLRFGGDIGSWFLVDLKQQDAVNPTRTGCDNKKCEQAQRLLLFTQQENNIEYASKQDEPWTRSYAIYFAHTRRATFLLKEQTHICSNSKP